MDEICKNYNQNFFFIFFFLHFICLRFTKESFCLNWHFEGLFCTLYNCYLVASINLTQTFVCKHYSHFKLFIALILFLFTIRKCFLSSYTSPKSHSPTYHNHPFTNLAPQPLNYWTLLFPQILWNHPQLLPATNITTNHSSPQQNHPPTHPQPHTKPQPPPQTLLSS